MKIDINNALTIISGLLLVCGAIYRLAQVEANINARIRAVETNVLNAVDELKNNFVDRLHTTEKKLDIHLTEYQGKKEYYEYRIHDFDSRLEHKFNRLRGLIKQLAGFLNKQAGFVLRDDEY
ncbi:hypothetical protein I8752_22795 [Nostocaceae cyanobacterium CENA369]|uniref:Uncharacterized protein n=1 Tax=Dendronalium phyllosphericum CENA369 TaxID=1725256 RepID=A0A8J7I7R6_9NOST|nr:hypothetical protein [Dendronalium phyllosphericum]MBH8575778.1 hypothetical protein [Dendronalium phyllosphericum CENA369]